MKTEFIWFPCQHHIYETILSGVFDEIFGTSIGPNIQQFVQFWDNSVNIKTKSTLQALPEYCFNTVQKSRWRSDTIECLQGILADNSSYIPRKDYKELIDLTLIIVYNVKNPNYKFIVTGALYRARRMCKIIYTFKMYLLREQYEMSSIFVETLEEFCLFCSLLYQTVGDVSSAFGCCCKRYIFNFIRI